MNNWRGEYLCPECQRLLRTLEPPDPCVAFLELYQCRECIIEVEQFGDRRECPLVFAVDEDGDLIPAPDLAQWMLADE